MARKAPGRKTGPKPQFSADDVVNGACELGIDDFSITDVAAKLGVVPSALYRHYKSREAIAHACLQRAANDLQVAKPRADWREVVREIVDNQWELCERYPGLAAAIMNNPGCQIYVMDKIREIVANLTAAGVPGGETSASLLVDLISDMVFVTHMWVTPLREADADGTTGLEKSWKIAESREGAGDFVRQVEWLERGSLDTKVDFIIRTVAAWGAAGTPD